MDRGSVGSDQGGGIMKRPVEEPVTDNTGSVVFESTTRHPAFAQIRAGRVTGHVNLHDSEFHHQAFITVEIHASEMNRSHHRSWPMPTDELIRVCMSESQWATFVSSLNCGSGTPCTLDRINGEHMPGLPDPVRETAKHTAEVRKRLETTMVVLKELETAIGEAGLSAKKADVLRRLVSKATMDLGCNLDFAVDSFAEHTELTVEKGKQEIHGYFAGMVARMGMEAIANVSPISTERIEDKP